MNVIVVPETNEYKLHVSHENVVWINPNIGTPKLKDRNVQYLAPYWITDGYRGVNRLFHIISCENNAEGVSVIKLGNSFVLDSNWDNIGQFRKFEYHALDEFGVHEIQPGLLVKNS